MNLKKLTLELTDPASFNDFIWKLCERNNVEEFNVICGFENWEDDWQTLFAKSLNKMTELRKLKINFANYDFSCLKAVTNRFVNLENITLKIRTTTNDTEVIVQETLQFLKCIGKIKYLDLHLPIPDEILRSRVITPLQF